uniref:Uncharacterized protein n=1 Tax=Arundo donax TaxID=35708 RepID=A0A0A9GRM4_ARUDO
MVYHLLCACFGWKDQEGRNSSK